MTVFSRRAKVDEAWADTWEELLDFTFPHPTKVSEENLPKKRKGGSLEPTFKKAKIITTGESMLADGTLDGLVFTSDEFNLECSNPKDETVTTTDLEHIIDVAVNKWIAITANPSMDLTARKHIGRELRALFPHLPDRGSTKGLNRDFKTMLKWRMRNARKTLSLNMVRATMSGYHTSIHRLCDTHSFVRLIPWNTGPLRAPLRPAAH